MVGSALAVRGTMVKKKISLQLTQTDVSWPLARYPNVKPLAAVRVKFL